MPIDPVWYVTDCKQCGGRGWYCGPHELYPDEDESYREVYCTCEDGRRRYKRETGEEMAMRDVKLVESVEFAEAQVDGHQVYVESTPGVPEYHWAAPHLSASGGAETYEEAVAALTAKLAEHGIRPVRAKPREDGDA